jgi:hypothetical protein
MSFEVSDPVIEDMNAPVKVIRDLRWTGCAVLRRTAAAYENTSIAVAA